MNEQERRLFEALMRARKAEKRWKLLYQGLEEIADRLGELAKPPGHIPPRCAGRKHVVENTHTICDCGRYMIGPTAAGNAQVITILTREGDSILRGDD